MSSQKEIVINYCKTVETHDIEHLQNAIENVQYIKDGEHSSLNGCPSSFGLDDYVGLCEILPDEVISNQTNKEVYAMCEACWKKALGVDKDEPASK